MHSITNDKPDSLHAEWMLSNHCNYQCSYCSPTLYSTTSGWPDVDTALDFWKSVHNEVNANKKMITLTGGEPTLWPKLFYFLENLETSYEVGIVSNGSRSLRWWEKLESIKRVKQLTISIHLEYVDVEHIASVVNVVSKSIGTTVLIVMNPNKLNESREFAEKLRDKNLTCKIVLKAVTLRHTANGETYPYDQDTIDFISNWHYHKKNTNTTPTDVSYNLLVDGEQFPASYAHALISTSRNCFKGWKCNIIKNRLVVKINGDVFGAQCKTSREYKLGNINDGYLDPKNIPVLPVTCIDDRCQCVPDLKIPKEKI